MKTYNIHQLMVKYVLWIQISHVNACQYVYFIIKRTHTYTNMFILVDRG